MATMMLPSPAKKRAKLASDYTTVSVNMASVDGQRFDDFKMMDG